MTHSMTTIDEIFSIKLKNSANQLQDPKRPVHAPWNADDDAEIWSPSAGNTYSGQEGGPLYGPLNRATGAARNASKLSDIFNLVVPILVFNKICEITHKYAYGDWVVETTGTDRDGNARRVKHFLPFNEVTEDARHRASYIKKKFKVTTGFILAWFGILIYHGGCLRDNGSPLR